MSHFFTLVIPNGKTVDDLLAPFNEQLEVPEYERPCFCVGRKAQYASSEQMQSEMGTWNAAREAFHKGNNKSDARWKKEVLDPRTARIDELIAQHPEAGKPNPECEECHGTGIDRTTYNPKSKWDWWVIGGRYGGIIAGSQGKVSRFIADDNKIPFAIVTPDGEWHEKGEMGWFGMVSDEKDDWDEQARAILAPYAEMTGIVCDLHI